MNRSDIKVHLTLHPVSMVAESSGNDVVWRHIGLHGHSVGTFACSEDKVVWKSAISGREDDLPASSTMRSIPAAHLKGAEWTIFGRSGHLRLQTSNEEVEGEKSSNLPHELRLDGFPPNDYDVLKDALQDKYHVALQVHTMSAAGTQYGLAEVKGKNLVFQHCVLDELNEEGQEFEPRAKDEMMSLHLTEVSQCVLPGNNRNEIEVQFPESDTIETGTDQLGKPVVRLLCYYISPVLTLDILDFVQFPFAFISLLILRQTRRTKRRLRLPNFFKPVSCRPPMFVRQQAPLLSASIRTKEPSLLLVVAIPSSCTTIFCVCEAKSMITRSNMTILTDCSFCRNQTMYTWPLSSRWTNPFDRDNSAINISFFRPPRNPMKSPSILTKRYSRRNTMENSSL